MAVKVQQSPDDPVLPVTVRDEILASSSRPEDGKAPGPCGAVHGYLRKHGVDPVTFLYAAFVVLGILIVGAVVAFTGAGNHHALLDGYDDEMDPLDAIAEGQYLDDASLYAEGAGGGDAEASLGSADVR